MARIHQAIKPFLWFEDQAEEAARFYVSVFPDSRIVTMSRYNSALPDKKGSVMVCKFELMGQEFLALNGGSKPEYNDSISLLVECETQAEVDHLWGKLTAGGGSERPCGWLKDKYGVSWQVTPRRLLELVQDPDEAKAARAMQAMFTMKKIVIAEIERAAAG
jgi:predicted 3-demethylubiquinone-9 3-methyltransferase (glyoxalase superfamily)